MKKVKLLVAFCICIVITDGITVYAKDDCFLTEEEVYEMAVEIGAMYDICSELLVSIAYQESRYKVNAVNGHNVGIMQNHDVYNKQRMERLEITDLYDPYSSMIVAADYLAELKAKYADVAYVLDIYHGDSRAEKNFKNGIISRYASQILERSASLEELHGK